MPREAGPVSARAARLGLARALALLVTLAAVAAPVGAGAAGASAKGQAAQGGAAPAAPVQNAWRVEFDDVCGKTQDAMGFAPEELRKLVQRCDALRPALEALGEPHRKIYLRRLQQCRDLYQFVLDTKASG